MLKFWKWLVLCGITLVAIVSCTAYGDGPDKSQSYNWVGQWKLSIPDDINLTSASVILTPEGKAYIIQNVASQEGQAAVELPLERMSTEGTLPDNIRIATFDEVFPNNVNRTKQGEAKAYINTANHTQLAYFHKNNNKFANSLKTLQIGTPEQTENYRYQMATKEESDGTEYVLHTATPLQAELKSYTGVVFVRKHEGSYTTLGTICESENPSTTAPEIVPPSTRGYNFTCPPGSRVIE